MERKGAWVAGVWDQEVQTAEGVGMDSSSHLVPMTPETQNCSSRLLLNDSDRTSQFSIVRLLIVIFEMGQLTGVSSSNDFFIRSELVPTGPNPQGGLLRTLG